VAVSIGLVVDGVPVVGVVHAPMLGDTYTARKGGGAQCNGVPLRISDRSPEQAICATGFPFRKKRERLSEYKRCCRAGTCRPSSLILCYESKRSLQSKRTGWTAVRR